MEVRITHVKGKQVKLLYLTKQDKINIRDMHPDCNVYAQYDDKSIMDDVVEIMEKFKKEYENKKEE